MFTLQGQCIFGLSAIFYNSTHMYGLVRANTVVRSIKKDDFARLMTEKICGQNSPSPLLVYLFIEQAR
jgi:hypothetical protein